MRKPHGFQRANKVPADVRLPPAQAQPRGTRVRVMVVMPVLPPRRQLQRPEPPDVLARVAIFRAAKVRQAIHEALHVQGIDKANGAGPEKSRPAEHKPRADGKRDDRAFRICPEFVDAACQLRAPSLRIGGRRLVQPAKMRPPESALLRAGNVVWRVRPRMMMPVISDPACRRPRAVE